MSHLLCSSKGNHCRGWWNILCQYVQSALQLIMIATKCTRVCKNTIIQVYKKSTLSIYTSIHKYKEYTLSICAPTPATCNWLWSRLRNTQKAFSQLLPHRSAIAWCSIAIAQCTVQEYFIHYCILQCSTWYFVYFLAQRRSTLCFIHYLAQCSSNLYFIHYLAM